MIEGTRATATETLLGQCARPMVERDLKCAQLMLSDWIGIALAARNEPAAKTTIAYSRSLNGTGPCSGLGVGMCAPECAAFLNGSFGTLLEMDDLHRASIMHAGDVVIPAAVAAAQFAGSSPQVLLEAIVVGYEVALRIGVVAANAGYTGWYNSGVCGVFGAAMAACHAAGATQEAKLDALGQAGMQASGVWQCRLEETDSKALATANAARAGVTSAFMAIHGCRGARQILEGPLGFFAQFYPQADLRGVFEHSSVDWMIHEVSFKPWPACRHVHPALGLALDISERVDVSSIEQVTINTYTAAIDFCDKLNPQTDHEARFSLQHCVAHALLYGRFDLDATKFAMRDCKELHQFRQKIQLKEDHEFTQAFPSKMGARMDIKCGGKQVLGETTHHALGDPELPMSNQQFNAKFKSNLKIASVPEVQTVLLSKALAELPQAHSMHDFNAALNAVSTNENSIHTKGEKYA